MKENELLKMLNIILDNIDMAERNQFSSDAIETLYNAKDVISAALKDLSN